MHTSGVTIGMANIVGPFRWDPLGKRHGMMVGMFYVPGKEDFFLDLIRMRFVLTFFLSRFSP